MTVTIDPIVINLHRENVDLASMVHAQLANLRESEKTAGYSVHHHPQGHGGKNWFTRLKPGNQGQWPAYLQNVRAGIMKGGVDIGRASALALGAVRRWASGRGNVSPEVRAAAIKALAEFEKLRAESKAMTAAAKVTEADIRECAMNPSIRACAAAHARLAA